MGSDTKLKIEGRNRARLRALILSILLLLAFIFSFPFIFSSPFTSSAPFVRYRGAFSSFLRPLHVDHCHVVRQRFFGSHGPGRRSLTLDWWRDASLSSVKGSAAAAGHPVDLVVGLGGSYEPLAGEIEREREGGVLEIHAYTGGDGELEKIVEEIVDARGCGTVTVTRLDGDDALNLDYFSVINEKVTHYGDLSQKVLLSGTTEWKKVYIHRGSGGALECKVDGSKSSKRKGYLMSLGGLSYSPPPDPCLAL
ncbi:hypothetical protein TrRE_jg6178 [Triparma retinervis]|uniref:Uncharacterized protein n=1 Tax=Triparma retinervis TaxID=2557542 RepID=A0A9W7L849_9STRA|nr:hypothetical protein TrRE_jg6178 [Triparma retinervis]